MSSNQNEWVDVSFGFKCHKVSKALYKYKVIYFSPVHILTSRDDKTKTTNGEKTEDLCKSDQWNNTQQSHKDNRIPFQSCLWLPDKTESNIPI